MLALLSAGIAPTLALMTFFYLKDRFNTEPLTSVFKTFIYGALLVFPIMFIQYAFMEEGIGQNPWIKSLILTGLLEEFFKWFIFVYTVYKYTEFDTLYDGIIYGVSISLGFATIENILYLFAHGIELAFGRAFFPVSSHALFGVIMGFYIGKAKYGSNNTRITLAVALLFPFLLHGFYDLILETVKSNWMYILVPFMIVLWLIGLRKVRLANKSNDIVILSKSEKRAQ